MYIPLHVHTEYSILDGMSTVAELCERAQELGLPGVAITDHGAMMGVKPFHDYFRRNAPDIKPILGNEIYLTDNYDFRMKDQEHRRTFHLILLAKNLAGYRNLCKITSIGATDGLYNKPRIDLSVLKEHREGLICLSGCIGGEIPQCILDDDIEGAEYAVKRYPDNFGDKIKEGDQVSSLRCEYVDSEIFDNVFTKINNVLILSNVGRLIQKLVLLYCQTYLGNKCADFFGLCTIFVLSIRIKL